MDDSPAARLRLFRETIGMEQRGLAAVLGVSPSSLSMAEGGKTNISKRLIDRLSSRFQLSPNWLLHGRGEMYFGSDGFEGRVSTVTPPDTSRPAYGDVSIDGVEFARIKVFDVRVSAGRGQLVPSDDVIDQISFTRSWLLRLGVNADLCGLVEVRGDSMAPHIRNGALVLVHFAEMEVINGLIYAFTLGDELFLKRLTRIEGGWLITADNPAYPPLQVMGADANMLQVHGRIRAAIDKF